MVPKCFQLIESLCEFKGKVQKCIKEEILFSLSLAFIHCKLWLYTYQEYMCILMNVFQLEDANPVLGIQTSGLRGWKPFIRYIESYVITLDILILELIIFTIGTHVRTRANIHIDAGFLPPPPLPLPQSIYFYFLHTYIFP